MFVLLGAVVLAWYGFGAGPMAPSGPWLGWLHGAILWTIALAIYYVRFAFEADGKPAKILLFLCVGLMIFLSVWFVSDILQEGGLQSDRAILHLELAIGVAVVLCCMDAILLYGHKKDSSKDEEDLSKKAARKALVYADLPPLVSFALLLLYLWRKPFDAQMFVSGAIAFQLCSSHVVFTAIEAEARSTSRPASEPGQVPAEHGGQAPQTPGESGVQVEKAATVGGN